MSDDDLMAKAQKQINDAANKAADSPSPTENNPIPTEATNQVPPEPPTPAALPQSSPEPLVQDNVDKPADLSSAEAAAPVDQILPQNNPPHAAPAGMPPKKPVLPKLLSLVLFFLLTIPLLAHFVKQRQQLADTRSQAALINSCFKKCLQQEYDESTCQRVCQGSITKPKEAPQTKETIEKSLESNFGKCGENEKRNSAGRCVSDSGPATSDSGPATCENAYRDNNKICVFNHTTGNPFCGGQGNRYKCSNAAADWGWKHVNSCSCPGGRSVAPGGYCLTSESCQYQSGGSAPGTWCGANPDPSCPGGTPTPTEGPTVRGTPTPTEGPTVQCRNIKIYKGGVQVTPSTLQPGDAVVLAVVGQNASKARIRVNDAAFTETSTKNSSGEFTLDFTVPTSGVTSFKIEAEVFKDGVWQ